MIRWLLGAIVLVVAASVTLVVGLIITAVTLVYVSIACSAVAAGLLYLYTRERIVVSVNPPPAEDPAVLAGWDPADGDPPEEHTAPPEIDPDLGNNGIPPTDAPRVA